MTMKRLSYIRKSCISRIKDSISRVEKLFRNKIIQTKVSEITCFSIYELKDTKCLEKICEIFKIDCILVFTTEIRRELF